MKLGEIAERIDAHLKRFERDKEVNAPVKHNAMSLRPFFNASAFAAGRYVCVKYISYQATQSLSKSDAGKYLAWLDAGNVGRHYEALR
jgi:hypothetical protein